jgi:ribulose-5-phosphate 4-epimerase/fuculose-1-phosphate aldolase
MSLKRRTRTGKQNPNDVKCPSNVELAPENKTPMMLKLETIDLDGEVLEHGSTSLGINKAGFILHSAIHQARPDIKCIIHLHTGDAVAVSIIII